MRVPGLDPGIDPRIHLLAKKMDYRVEPDNDDRDLIRAKFAVVSIAQEQTFALHVVVAAGRRSSCNRVQRKRDAASKASRPGSYGVILAFVASTTN